MRYREYSPTGDYVFGGNPVFLVNSPETVGQAIESRMNLYVREWFLDLREGLDLSNILGFHTVQTRDLELKRRIMGTQGVIALDSYYSNLSADRVFSVRASVSTLYGAVIIKKDYTHAPAA